MEGLEARKQSFQLSDGLIESGDWYRNTLVSTTPMGDKYKILSAESDVWNVRPTYSNTLRELSF